MYILEFVTKKESIKKRICPNRFNCLSIKAMFFVILAKKKITLNSSTKNLTMIDSLLETE